MKKLINLLIVGVLGGVLGFGLAGCATTGGITPDKVQRGVDSIVGTFTVIRLKSHPDSKPAFEAARDAINVLVANETWDIAAFGEVLASTGLADGAGDNLGLYISNGVTLINLFTGENVDLKNVLYAKAVILGGAEALNRTVK